MKVRIAARTLCRVSCSALLGNLQAFVRYIWQINDPLSQISQLSSQVQSAFAAMGRIFNLMDEEEEVQNGKVEIREDANCALKEAFRILSFTS